MVDLPEPDSPTIARHSPSRDVEGDVVDRADLVGALGEDLGTERSERSGVMERSPHLMAALYGAPLCPAGHLPL